MPLEEDVFGSAIQDSTHAVDEDAITEMELAVEILCLVNVSYKQSFCRKAWIL